MSVLFIVLPLALLLVAVAVGAFAWVVRSGQLDDLDTPQHRILADERAGLTPPGGGARIAQDPHRRESIVQTLRELPSDGRS